MLEPACEADLAEIVADAAARGDKVAIAGGGTKSAMGRPVDVATVSMLGLAGIVDYDPAELVLTVKPGTPLAEVDDLIAGERQMLAFEPFDHGPIAGLPRGRSTIGGVVAAAVAGSRRLTAGATRDHLLGLRAVSGRGEAFAAGAKVVKNVTGFDVPKLAAGSWGRLFALTELTLKVLPRPEISVTRIVEGFETAQASRVMASVMGSNIFAAAVAHVPPRDSHRARTVFRLEGFGPSVAARSALLDQLIDGESADGLNSGDADAFWDAVRTFAFLPPDPPLWRISVPPREMPGVTGLIDRTGGAWYVDWAGGLILAALENGFAELRAAAYAVGGHATLVRAAPGVRDAVPAFHPQPAGLAALEQRVRRAFDPLGVFETGRF